MAYNSHKKLNLNALPQLPPIRQDLSIASGNILNIEEAVQVKGTEMQGIENVPDGEE